MARIFLSSNETFNVTANNDYFYGASGSERVNIASGTTGITINANVESVQFSGALSTYKFKQTGNRLEVYDSAGTTLISKIGLQGDSNGTQLTFSNGTFDAKYLAGASTLNLMIGGLTVSGITPTNTILSMGTTSFDFSTDSTTNFSKSGSAFGWSGGVVTIPATGSGSDEIWTLNQAAPVTVNNDTYTVSAFVHNAANSGYGGLGFSTNSSNSSTNNGVIGSSASPVANSFLGVSFHGGGGNFLNDGIGSSWLNGSDLVLGHWYKMVFTVTETSNTSFDLKLDIYDATDSSTVGTLFRTHTATVTNSNIAGFAGLYPYFANEGSRLDSIDNFEVVLSYPIIDFLAAASSLANGSATVDVTGADSTQIAGLVNYISKVAVGGLTGTGLSVTDTQFAAIAPKLATSVTDVIVDATAATTPELQALSINIDRVSSITNLTLTAASQSDTETANLLSKAAMSSASIVATGATTTEVAAMATNQSNIATSGITGAISLTAAQFTTLSAALNASATLTVTDTPIAATVLTAMDTKSSVAVDATAVTTITGTAAEVASVANSAGITKSSNFAATINGTSATAGNLMDIDLTTTGLVTAAAVTTITGLAVDIVSVTDAMTLGGKIALPSLSTLNPTDAIITTTFNNTVFTQSPVTINLANVANNALTIASATIGAGNTLNVIGSALTGANALTFNGSAETDGKFSIVGGAGSDTITGGAGSDTITGGAGIDVFKFLSATTNGKDTITDFVSGAGGDVLDVTAFDPTAQFNWYSWSPSNIALITVNTNGTIDSNSASAATGGDPLSIPRQPYNHSITVVNMVNTAIAAKDYSSANFGDIFGTSAKAFSTTAQTAGGNDKAVILVEGTDQTQVYFAQDTHTNGTWEASDLTLVAVLTGTNNTGATWNVANFLPYLIG